jgi:uncharacterized membrane protein YphA (DoxX/SURF4 family)
MAALATALETTFAIALLVPRWARVAAGCAAILLSLFALAMATANGIKSPLNYSVFVDAAAAFLLYAVLSPA